MYARAGSPFLSGQDCQHRAVIKGVVRLLDDLSPSPQEATVSSTGGVAGANPLRRQNFVSASLRSYPGNKKASPRMLWSTSGWLFYVVENFVYTRAREPSRFNGTAFLWLLPSLLGIDVRVSAV